MMLITRVAHAPEPHAKVFPAPLSHTFILIVLSPKIVANSILIPSGKLILFWILGPISSILTFLNLI